ncbi:aspartic peptidase domain-containing protein [Mycena olivaceomarginata]|nr:aspartic peptidase domain-containing protein [Mycena olivaceomarginata]
MDCALASHAHQEATALFPPAKFSIPFIGKAPHRRSKMDTLRRGVYLTGNGTSTVALDVSHFETEYLVNVMIGGQDFTVIGLAFPSLTAVHNITDGTRALYDPFFFTAVKQKKLKNSIFSVSIDRGTIEGRGNNPVEHNIGFLSFGGMPPVPVVNTSVTVPIQGYTVVNSTGIPSDGPDAMFFFYTVDIQSYTFPGSDTVVTASNNTILDSGTTFNLLPDDVAAVFATGFNPPATLITNPLNDRPIYIVDCNATAPEFQVTLGGKRFSIDPRDQIVASGKFDNGTITCASGTQPISAISPGFDTQFILGHVFLHNVVSTFNPIDREVTLTQRAEY